MIARQLLNKLWCPEECQLVFPRNKLYSLSVGLADERKKNKKQILGEIEKEENAEKKKVELLLCDVSAASLGSQGLQTAKLFNFTFQYL